MVTKAIEWIEASHLFIAFMAVLLTLETYEASSVAWDWGVALLVGAATGGFYVVHRILQLRRYHTARSPRIDVLHRHRRLLYTMLPVYGFLGLSVAWGLAWETDHLWYVVALAAALGLYILPLNGAGYTLRDLPYIKLIYIAIGWASVTCLLPTLWLEEVAIRWGLWVERCLFFLLITVPFDIRDMAIDGQVGLRTVATTWSLGQLRWLMLVLWVAHALWVGQFVMQPSYALTLWMCGLLAVVMGRKSSDRGWPYFSYGLDGLIGLRLVMWSVIG